MIKADFYPTQDTWNLDNKSVELTAFLNTMEYTSDIGQQYVMGYVPYDYVPTFGRLSHIHRVDTEGAAYLEFTDAIDQDNYGWTLTADTGKTNHSDTNSSAGAYTLYEYNVGGTWYKQGAGGGYTSGFDTHNTRFINKMEIATQNCRLQNVRMVARTINHEPVEGRDDYYWATNIEIDNGNILPDGEDAKGLYDWLYNDAVASVRFQLSVYPNYVPTVELRASDFSSGAAELTIDYVDPDTQEVMPGRYTVKIWICGYTINQARMIGDEDGVGGYFAPAPTYYLHSSQAGLSYFYRSSGSHSIRKKYVTSGNYDYITLKNEGLELVGGMPIEMGGEEYILGGLVGRIPASFLTNAARGAVLEQTTFIVYKRFSDSVWILRIVHPEEIKRDLEMQTKVMSNEAASRGAIYGFSDETHVPYFNESDTPQWTLLTGDLEKIEDDLRPWQLNDISDNDFNWDDIPPYTPPGPGPGPGPINPPDEGDWGADIPYTIFQMGNNPFSNFEQLTYGGLEEFMATLWHAPQTFWESLSATKELSANLNDYLISCRAYPIFINGALAHNDIYLGVGGKITLANTIYTPNIVNICACGSITVARPYGNFLDYNPYTSASIYLPFAGQFEINPKYIYDTELSLILWVDLTDGSGVWVLRNTAHTYPILIKQCKVGIDIPISGQDAAQKSSNIINATLNTAQHALTSVNRITGIATQVGSAIASGGVSGGSGINIGTEAAGMALAGLSDSVNMAMANKELPYYTTGSAGAAAAEACSEPYITLRAPLCENPTNFAHTVGNLYNKAATISSLSGFTTCRNIDVGGISQATDKEKAQIKQILESGFYA